jgi:ABC-2 type transport system permease protein/lipopolysaccharide transport system permease protein
MDLLVARQVAASLPRMVLALVVAYAALAFRPRPPGAAFLLPLVAMGLQLAASQGLGLALAPLAVLRPGARAVLASALTLLTFASPIVYPEEMLGSAALRAIEWNPFTSALRLYRAPLGSAPTLGDVTFVAAFAAACLGAGAFVKGRLYWPARDRL